MSTINFNDAIFAQEALQAFIANCPWLGLFSHSFNDESAQVGSVVYVPRVDALVATTFNYTDNSGFPYEQTGGVVNTITVTLDQQFICPVDVSDLQAANSSAAKVINFARQQGKAMAKGMWQRVATLFTTVNYGLASSISIANYGYTAGVSIRTKLAKRDVPIDMVNLIINEDVQNSFLNDSIVYQNQVFGVNANVAMTGVVPKVAGMPVYETNVMPTNGISLVGIAAHPDSVALACRYLTPINPGAYLDARRVVDDSSGIVMGYRRHYSPGRGKMFVNFEGLFGFAVGLSLGLAILARAD